MSKFDKKVLKFISARQEDDLDLDDIAIGLRLDEDAVRETLDSLKDQGKIEDSPRNGKTYWRISVQEKVDANETEQFELRKEPGVVSIDFDQSIEERAPAPVSQKIEPKEIEKDAETSDPIVSTQKQSAPDIDDATDDKELEPSPKLLDSSVVMVAIAVMVSLVVSVIASIIVSGGSNKGNLNAIQAVERNSNEKCANLEKRITELSAQLNVLDQKVSGKQVPRAEQNKALKPARSSHKKKSSPVSPSSDENNSSEPSASDQSTPSSTSGQGDNPAPAPEPASLPSTEGTGGSGQ